MPAEDLVRAARLYGGAGARRSSGAWASPSTRTAPTACARWPTWRSCAAPSAPRAGCGVNPLRGQNNVQGASDMGAMPDILPGYQKVADDAARAGSRGLGSSDPAAARPADPGDVRRRPRRGAARRCGSSARTCSHRSRRRHVARRSSLPAGGLQGTFLSETARPPTSSSRPRPSWRRTAPSSTSTAASSVSARPWRPPGGARTDFGSSARSRPAGRRPRLPHAGRALAECAASRRCSAGSRTSAWTRGPAAPGRAGPARRPGGAAAATSSGSPPPTAGRTSPRSPTCPGRGPSPTRVPVPARHRPPARALQRGHDDPPDREPRPAAPRSASR